MVRIVSLILIIFTLSSLFTGCYDRNELDDMGYALGLGIDKSENDLLKITLQLAVTKDNNGGDDIYVKTIEAPNIYSGLNLFNSILNKNINLSHVKVIAFSQELAEEGLEEYINEIMSNKEFRPGMQVIVVMGTAQEYLKSVEPILESNLARYYELKSDSYLYTDFNTDIKFYDFYINTQSRHSQPIAALVGIDIEDEDEEIEEEENEENDKEDDDDESSPVAIGLAVFNGSKMVGILDNQEIIYYLMTTGEFNYSYVSIPDPINEGKFVVLNISQKKKPSYKIEFDNDTPYIGVNIKLGAKIVSAYNRFEYEDRNNLEVLEIRIKEFIERGVLNYLNITKELQSDISGVGSSLRRHFTTWNEWDEFNWLGMYGDSTFDVNVSVDSWSGG